MGLIKRYLSTTPGSVASPSKAVSHTMVSFEKAQNVSSKGCLIKCVLPCIEHFKHMTFLKIFFYIYLFLIDRERQSRSGGGAEREGNTESEAGSRLWGVSSEPDTGLEPTNHEIMTWVEGRRLTDWATRAPLSRWLLTDHLIFLGYRELAA